MRGTGNLKWLVIGLLAAVVVGLAVTLQVRDWMALGAETGGSCGTSSRGTSSGPCPQNWATIFVLSLFSLMVFVPLSFYALFKAGTVGRVAGLLVTAVGIYPGVVLFDALHGESVEVAWSTPSDTVSDAETEGVWTSGDLVVRARFDGLTAFDSGSGARRWESPLPGRDVLCGMSRTAAAGIGMIAEQETSTKCSRVSAVDLATGKNLWSAAIPPAEAATGRDEDRLAVAGDSAVIGTERTLEARGARDGRLRWRRDPKSELCRYSWIAGAADRVVVSERCNAQNGTFTEKLLALDPATGRARWSLPVPAVGNANLTLISADPLVVHVRETDQRGTTSLLAVDAEGRITATIPAEAVDVSAVLPSRSIPVHRIAVTEDAVIAVTRTPDSRYQVTAFALAGGRSLWTTKKGRDSISALVADGPDVLLTTSRFSTLKLRVLDPATGAERGSATVPLDRADSRFQLVPAPGALVVVSGSGRNPYHPLQGFPRLKN
ncbi:PQQ-binding-like beta-propeller repeat protein [Actinocorallia longicatena]|uniref:Pyrrolo-quinoline quinone repeat domain-containing protein n=1 Tax=Actinocorallia longicatena TaxID=111803 RepID=A0ABP6QG33_9ACTN